MKLDAHALPKAYHCPTLPAHYAQVDVNTLAYQLLISAAGNSLYLASLLDKYPATALNFIAMGADSSFATLDDKFSNESEAALMRNIRHYKQQAALIIALADIAGQWNLQQVTLALSHVATITLNHSFDYLLKHYQAKRSLQVADAEDGCGIIVLALGKLGGDELNYSSDIDLILLYEHTKLSLPNDKAIQRTLNHFAQDLVKLMQLRTAEGYVFRVDLRLRPDPSSTPLMVSTAAAMRYYESVGQNWERAAYIKAKPIAGDIGAGERFLENLKPFIWRKSLDFAAISDIQSIKRQMDRAFDNTDFTIADYDVKKGLGGIREIEFLAQIHQLIWGGKKPELRSRRTLETYQTLQRLQLLSETEVKTLSANYEQLRHIEHRLQMVQDEQTHTIPVDEEKRTRIAYFCGDETLEIFEKSLQEIVRTTHEIYGECFNESDSLAGDGKLSFTGVSHDSDTIKTLQKMGFNDAAGVCDKIQSWHRGSVPAMRSRRSRELLTELTPVLLQQMTNQPDADSAFRRFARFFSNLPSGVGLLSLLHSNPQLLETLVTIIGNAPQMAQYLSKHPDWMDALLTLNHDEILTIDKLKPVSHYKKISNRPEEAASWLCRYRCEHEFILGCQVLAGIMPPLATLPILSHIADNAVVSLSQTVIDAFEADYGIIAGCSFAVVALGRLGSNELTFGSDLDLLFLYDAPSDAAESDGKRSLGVSAYYNRLAQRIIGQLSAMTPEGRLYEVDGRLRPAGKDGPLAVSLTAIQKYYRENAWTFERMALLKQRIIFTTNDKINIAALMQHKADAATIKQDALEMRIRLWQQHGTNNEWNVKQSRGGLMDITFIAQVISLQNIEKHPELIGLPLHPLLEKLAALKLLDSDKSQQLSDAYHFQQSVQLLMRLCHNDASSEVFSVGLKEMMARSLGLKEFNQVQEQLHQHRQASYKLFNEMIGDYL